MLLDLVIDNKKTTVIDRANEIITPKNIVYPCGCILGVKEDGELFSKLLGNECWVKCISNK